MGGSGGYNIPREDLDKLEKQAKEKLDSGKKNVFISFPHENENEVNLLRGQAKNENSDLEMSDHSVKEPFNSDKADYIKRKITEKIERASVTLVYLSNETASSDWVKWEVEQSFKMGKGVIAVHKGDRPPSNISGYIKNNNNIKVVKWEHDAINSAIDEASRNRKKP